MHLLVQFLPHIVTEFVLQTSGGQVGHPVVQPFYFPHFGRVVCVEKTVELLNCAFDFSLDVAESASHGKFLQELSVLLGEFGLDFPLYFVGLVLAVEVDEYFAQVGLEASVCTLHLLGQVDEVGNVVDVIDFAE